MKERYAMKAAALWLLGLVLLVGAGRGSLAIWWRAGAAAVFLAVAVIGVAYAVRRGRADAAHVALVGSLLVTAALPAPASTPWSAAILLAALGSVLVGYFVLTLRLRAHGIQAPVLQHGARRIAAVVGVSSLLVLAVVVGLRSALAVVSARWSASLDLASPHLLAALGVLVLAFGTGSSLLALSRARVNVEDEPTGAKAGPPSEPGEPARRLEVEHHG